MQAKLPRAPTHNYPAANICIYCGTRERSLTDEHIVPYGLNGNLVLPKSSCSACAKITSATELKVLRGFLNAGRRKIGIKSRHKRAQKLSTPVKYIIGDEYHDGESSFIDGIQSIHLPIFSTPLALGGTSKNGYLDSIDIAGFDTMQFDGTIPTINGQKPNGIRIHTRVHIWNFIRMIAKIAHSYHVAIKGSFPLNESPIVKVALNKSNNVKPWIGCLEQYPLSKPESTALHLLDLNEIEGEDNQTCTVVRIKLLSPTSGPTYTAITRIHSNSGIA
jgi:hypothetical protein